MTDGKPSLLVPALGAVFLGLRQSRRALTVVERLLSSVAVGLLSERQLTELTLSYYANNDKYLREAQIEEGLKDWELAAIEA